MHLRGEAEEWPVFRPQSAVPSLSLVPSGLHSLGTAPLCLPVSHPDLPGRVEVPASLQSAHSGPQGATRETLPILQTEKLRREEVKALAQSPDGSGSARTPATCAGFPGPRPFSTAHQKTLRGVCIEVHSLQLPSHQAPRPSGPQSGWQDDSPHRMSLRDVALCPALRGWPWVVGGPRASLRGSGCCF